MEALKEVTPSWGVVLGNDVVAEVCPRSQLSESLPGIEAPQYPSFSEVSSHLLPVVFRVSDNISLISVSNLNSCLTFLINVLFYPLKLFHRSILILEVYLC